MKLSEGGIMVSRRYVWLFEELRLTVSMVVAVGWVPWLCCCFVLPFNLVPLVLGAIVSRTSLPATS
jgi:hypothetical protein